MAVMRNPLRGRHASRKDEKEGKTSTTSFSVRGKRAKLWTTSLSGGQHSAVYASHGTKKKP